MKLNNEQRRKMQNVEKMEKRQNKVTLTTNLVSVFIEKILGNKIVLG